MARPQPIYSKPHKEKKSSVQESIYYTDMNSACAPTEQVDQSEKTEYTEMFPLPSASEETKPSDTTEYTEMQLPPVAAEEQGQTIDTINYVRDWKRGHVSHSNNTKNAAQSLTRFHLSISCLVEVFGNQQGYGGLVKAR